MKHINKSRSCFSFVKIFVFLRKSDFLLIVEISFELLLWIGAFEGDHLGKLGKSPLKALTVNSKYSSISAEKRNLFGITERVDNIRLKELSKGINSTRTELTRTLPRCFLNSISFIWAEVTCIPFIDYEFSAILFTFFCGSIYMSRFVRSYLALVVECIKTHDV